jgi:curli biogenesis system outer membrane secretion channel CsgG
MKHGLVASAVILCALVTSCGTIATEKNTQSASAKESFPPYSGPKSRVQVIQLGIPDEIVKKYPELAEKRVGWGMYERIIDTFYETGRFAFVEEKADIQERILKQWELSLSGLVAQDQIPPDQGLLAPEYLVYAEVYEFSTSDAETVVGAAARKDRSTIVGIQLRLVEVANGSYVPATGLGEATTTSLGVWAPELSFDQSTVGIATQKAVRQAVASLLKRME